MKFQTHYKRTEDRNYEVNTMPSKTIPDMTMGIREVFERFRRGQPLSGGKEPMYYDEEVLDRSEFQRLDLSEQHDILEAARKRTQRTMDRLRRKNEKMQTEAAKELFRKEFLEELNSKTVEPVNQNPQQ